MKKLVMIAVATMLAAPSFAFADTIADWTFESSQPPTAGPFAAESGANAATSLALGHHADGSAVYSSPAGDGSSHSFSSTRWGIGDYYQFETSTFGYSNIDVSFDQTSSSGGPANFELDFSTDGIHFSTGVTYVVGDGSWNTTTSTSGSAYGPFGFSGQLDNESTIFIRLIDTSTASAGGGTVATTGTDRVDNFSITGTLTPTSATPLPSSVYAALAAIPFLAFARFRRRIAGS